LNYLSLFVQLSDEQTMNEFNLKALRPSATQANFMANNTILPVLLWTMIFKKKSALENEALDDNIYDKKNNIRSLRSGLKYIIPKGIEMNLKEKMLNDSYTLFNSFIFQQKLSKKHPYSKAMMYKCIFKFINYLMNWSHFIILNAKVYNNQTFHNLYETLRKTSFRMSSEIMAENTLYPGRTEKQKRYCEWSKQVADDIITFQGYMSCNCKWYLYQNKEWYRCKKCDVCYETEQYFYNYDNYLNSFMVLRNGRRVRKHYSIRKHVIIQNVYQIVGN
jgi:hypothetical protein